MPVLSQNLGIYIFFVEGRIWTEDPGSNWKLWEDLDSVQIIESVPIIIFII